MYLVQIEYFHILVAFVQPDDGTVELCLFDICELHILFLAQPVLVVADVAHDLFVVLTE